MRTGVLYQRGIKGTGVVEMGKLVRTLKRIAWGLKWMGMGFTTMGMAGVIWIWGPLAISNLEFLVAKQIPNPKIQTQSEIPNWKVPDDDYSIYIPKIGAISTVISNVDANNKKVYLEALKLGVAEASGLAHPGESGTTFLFAHSVANPLDYARYNAVFYLLDKLRRGDEIQVVYKSKLLRYEVAEVSRLSAGDTRYLRPQRGEELLVLQTCWPAGTSLKRLVLTARPVMVY